MTALTSCHKGETKVTTVVIDQRDSSAYRRGMTDARVMLEECHDDDALHDYLLEIRARETNIRSRMRPQAGDAYIEGFKEYVSQHNDSLAQILF